MQDETEVQTSTRTFAAPSHIPEGLYAAQLKEIKTKKSDGSPLENKYGPQAIVEFDIYKLNNDGSVGERVTSTTANIMTDVTLGQFINTAYKRTMKDGTPVNGPDGKQVIDTAFTPPGKKISRATETFLALGWAGPDGRPLSLKSFIGKWARVMVEDYTPDGQATRSSITKVKPYEGPVPAATPAPAPATKITPKADEYLVKLKGLREKLDEGMLTERGYEIGRKSLMVEYGITED